jgi:predicted RNase H-like HicB family nuclease
MAVTQYIALLHKRRGKGYGVSFPDFPGCTAIGDNVASALREAAEALAFHVEGMREDGQKLPKPRTLEHIRKDGEDWIEWKGAIVATAPLLPPEGRSLRVQITMDERLLSKIDAVTSNRSAFLSEAARRLLDERSSVKDHEVKNLR